MGQQNSGGTGSAPVDRGFHTLLVDRVVQETADTVSLVLDVPAELRGSFGYRAGQFCTFRVGVDGAELLRCYSMSSSPEVDDALAVTVKRVPGGAVSNWINDNVSAGDRIEATCPTGVFRLPDTLHHLVAFAAGSGITPVISLVKSALASTDASVRLLYANKDVDSVIFRDDLAALVAEHGDRLVVTHRLDAEHGFVDDGAVREFLDGRLPPDAEVYICGPTPFMDITEAAVLALGGDPQRTHVERFTPSLDWTEDVADGDPGAGEGTDAAERPTEVTIELDGRTETATHRAGTTVLQVARQVGMTPPYSCESGTCATCMAKLVEGTVKMHVNDVLTDEEVEEGWVLTCQSVPTSDTVHVVYGFD